MKKLFLIGMLIAPWLTLSLLGRNALKKYLPAAIFICTFVKAIDMYGERKKWWRFYKGIPPFNSMNFLNFGPYFVTSLWMLKMTYGKFTLYMFFNTVLHIFFTVPGLKYLKRYKIASLVKMTKIQYLAVNTLRALLLYGFQYINDLEHGNKTHFKK